MNEDAVWNIAEGLVTLFGSDAGSVAAKMFARNIEDGEDVRANCWTRVLAAIDELHRLNANDRALVN